MKAKVALTALLLLASIGCRPSHLDVECELRRAEEERKIMEVVKARNQTIIDSGVRAAKAGAGGDANPHTRAQQRELWLEGWIIGKKSEQILDKN